MVVVDAFVYHKYCKSRCVVVMNLENKYIKVSVGGETTSPT
jgi:hypothetical protein